MTGGIFEASTDEVAGMGVFTDGIGNDIQQAATLINDHAGLFGSHYSGIIAEVEPFVNSHRDIVYTRLMNSGNWCRWVSVELNRAAWMYYDTDKQTYDALNAHMAYPSSTPYGSDKADPGAARPHPSPAQFSKPHNVDPKAPEASTDVAEIKQAIDDAMGWVGDVDDKIKEYTGWSPVEEALKPIGGKWNELERVGETYKVAGEAIEQSGQNLLSGLHRVRESWDGRAAVNFDDYAGRQAAAMEWWGPAGRVTETALKTVAQEIKKAVVEAAKRVADMVKEEVEITDGKMLMKQALKKVPIAGTAWQLQRIYDILDKARDHVMTLVNGIREIVQALKQFLEVVADPKAAAEGKVAEKLKPIKEKLDKANENVQLAQDIERISHIEDPAREPDNFFKVGEGRDPWANAV